MRNPIPVILGATALALILAALAPGCGLSRLETAHAVQTESDVYIANQQSIATTCPTVTECTRLLDIERARYRAARAAVCRAGKGC